LALVAAGHSHLLVQMDQIQYLVQLRQQAAVVAVELILLPM
jgi:hypothetical protein